MNIIKELNKELEVMKALNRAHLVPKQIQVRNAKGKVYMKTVYVNPNKKKKLVYSPSKLEEDERLDREYMQAVKDGDIDKLRKMVIEKAEKNGFKNAIPEQAEGYSLRITRPPKKTKTVYKTFYVDTNGKPSALFIGNNENIPMNVWVDAKDAFHFTDPTNGRVYVPSMPNPTNKKAGKTGDMRKFDEETKKELVKRGYITEKANSITALAYRPGWHAGDLPFFPQGGTKIKGQKTNYDNIHRWNQVVFEIEVDADTDYTGEAQKGLAAKKAAGDRSAKADLQYMPEHGFYQFTTNPTVKKQTGGKGDWFISHSIKIKRALTEEECNKILAENGMKPQEWESMDGKGIGPMDLSKLGYTGEDYDAARKTLAPITYDDDGEIIPLSQRFNRQSNDVRKSLDF
jgi:hypothetical protein